MPWKISSLVGQRLRFVQTVLRRVHSVAQVCGQFGISQKTGFKWLRRFARAGGPGLQDQSRRPGRSPGRLAARWQQAIARWHRHRPRWGAKKIHARLRREHPRAALPCVLTVHRWLRRWGRVTRRSRTARRGPSLPRPQLTVPRRPNQVWTVDFKGRFHTGDGQRVDPLTVRDLFSRYLLGIGLVGLDDAAVRRYFVRLFRRYGQPEIIRVDHGSPFAGDGPLDLSRLSAWWLRLGIRVEFTRRAHPQDNGAHEQMHRIYKAEVATPPARTPAGQQRRSTRWVRDYNYQRPHEALGQRVPAQFYRPSRRPYAGRLPALTYRRHWPTRRVSARGTVFWRGRRRGIGRAFAGERVGFKPVAEGTHEVYFGRQLIGQLVERDPGGLRPAHWKRLAEPPPALTHVL